MGLKERLLFWRKTPVEGPEESRKSVVDSRRESEKVSTTVVKESTTLSEPPKESAESVVKVSTTLGKESETPKNYTIEGSIEGMKFGAGLVGMAKSISEYNNLLRENTEQLSKLGEVVATKQQVEDLSNKTATKDLIQGLYDKLDELRQVPEAEKEVEEIEKGVIGLELKLSDRLNQALEFLQEKKQLTPKDLAILMNIKHNTATEYLQKLVKAGKARKMSYGVYSER